MPRFDPTTSTDLGYEVTPDSFDGSAFAVIRGDAAVLVPTKDLVLGPLGVLGVITCTALLLISGRRGGTAPR